MRKKTLVLSTSIAMGHAHRGGLIRISYAVEALRAPLHDSIGQFHAVAIRRYVRVQRQPTRQIRAGFQHAALSLCGRSLYLEFPSQDHGGAPAAQGQSLYLEFTSQDHALD